MKTALQSADVAGRLERAPAFRRAIATSWVLLLTLVTLTGGGCHTALWNEVSGHPAARFGVLAYGQLWVRGGEVLPPNLTEISVVQNVATGWMRRVPVVPLHPSRAQHGWVAYFALASPGEARKEVEAAQLETSKAMRIAHCKKGDYGVHLDVWEDEENNLSPLWQAYFSFDSDTAVGCPPQS